MKELNDVTGYLRYSSSATLSTAIYVLSSRRPRHHLYQYMYLLLSALSCCDYRFGLAFQYGYNVRGQIEDPCIKILK